MNVPIIRLEIEGMKHTIMIALAEHVHKIDSDIQAAVAEYCKPDNLSLIVQGIASKAIDEAMESEIEHFFRYGEGRKQVASAVMQTMAERYGTSDKELA